MNCRYSKETDQPWFAENPDGPKTIRCYRPDAESLNVASGFHRKASIGDTIHKFKPVRPQLINNADYVAVRACSCNPDQCAFYESK